jgi:hypothetical protein
MNERELLEQVAKAAGLEKHFVYSESCQAMVAKLPSGIVAIQWNPLRDDSNAFRLAVNLELRVIVEIKTEGYVKVEWGDGHDNYIRVDVPKGEDGYAATRRAIVLAAIKAMM